MRVKLKRHHHPSNPNWIIVKESVPLGTEYQVLDILDVKICNLETGEESIESAYYLKGNNSIGVMPACVFETIH